MMEGTFDEIPVEDLKTLKYELNWNVIIYHCTEGKTGFDIQHLMFYNTLLSDCYLT